MRKKAVSILCVLTVIFQLLTGMTVHGAEAENLALSATPSASSCDAGNKIYSIETLNDGITGNAFDPSWSSSNQDPKSGGVWATLTWSNPVTFNHVKLYTVRGYELKDYDIQIDENGTWKTVLSVKDNVIATMDHLLDDKYTTKGLRILCWSGPDIQDYIARLTEIEVFFGGDPLSKAEETLALESSLITEDISLPTKSEDGAVRISWSSSNPDVIGNDGQVTRPAFEASDVDVTLTAELTFGTHTLQKVFPVKVKKLPPNAEVVMMVKEKLCLGNRKNIVDDIELPLTDPKKYTNIRWVSSDESVISKEGKVTRSPEGTKNVTLTAIITRGEDVANESFDFTVLQAENAMETVTAEKWRVAEIVLESKEQYEYPYLDVDTSVTFTSPSGKKIKRDAFYDGGNIWRVRFAPTEEGEWTYVTGSSNSTDTGLHGRCGKVVCVPYSGDLEIYKHGFVQREEGKRYLSYADGTPFLYIADCGWMSLSSRAPFFDTNKPELGTSVFKTIIDTREKQGYNGYRMNFFIGLGGDVYGDGNKNEGGYPWTKGKPYATVCSSEYCKDNEMHANAYRIIDGIEDNYWQAADENYPAWVGIDWQTKKTFNKFRVVFAREDTWNFDIEISNDGQNYTKIYSTPKAGFKGKIFEYELAGAQEARFCRVKINGCASGKVARVGEFTPFDTEGNKLTHYWYFRDLNADFFKNTDDRIQYIVNKGMIADLGLDWGRQLMPGMQNEYKRFAKYLSARYGAYPVIWHGGGEVGTGCLEEWLKIAQYMNEIDSYNHVNTVHNDVSNPDYSLCMDDLSWHDMNYTQSGHDINVGRDIKYWQNIYNRKPVKPFIEGEIYFESIKGLPSYVTREAYWKTIMAGGVGFAYSAEGLWQLSYDYEDYRQLWGSSPIPWYVALYKEAGAQLPYMKSFLEALNWSELMPDEGAVTWNNPPTEEMKEPFQKRNLDSSVVIAYMPASDEAYNGAARLRPNSEFTAKWYNTRTGEYTLINDKIQTDQSGVWVMPQAPDHTADWAILIMLNAKNADAFKEISFDRMSHDQYYDVQNDIELINKTSDGTTVTWQSSNNDVINSTTGKVTRGAAACGVTLIAKITTDKGTDYKYFYLTVAAE